ncbi:MAG: protease inhibitor I42 family protein [Chloroflexales bacterium]
MLRMTIAIIITATLLIVGGCGSDGGGPRQLHAQDTGQAVELRTGGQLEITLDGNPTTGYTWEQTEGDGAVVKRDGEPAYTSERNVPGAGGTYVFRFTAVAPGQTTLTLIYYRPFERNAPPLKTFTVPITVR